MIVCYLSGPISNGGRATTEERFANSNVSHAYHRQFVESGVAVINPMLTQHVDPFGDVPHGDWLAGDFEIIKRCDCVYRLPGASSGADAECAFAGRHGIPVFEWAVDVIELAKKRSSESVLDVALRVAGHSRSRDYGHPLENHERIASLWNAFISGKSEKFLSAEDVAYMMILMKIARQQNTHKDDNLIDIGGYVRCIELMNEKRNELSGHGGCGSSTGVRSEGQAT